MRLTTYMRQAFVNAAMHDVPSVDYIEQARSLVNKLALEIVRAQKLNSINPDRLSQRNVIVMKAESTYDSFLNAHVIGLTQEEAKAISKLPELHRLALLSKEQREKQEALRRTLKSAIDACATRKQAVDALPEFEKYLPQDEAKAIRSVPVIANVVSDFVKAGWPKGQKKIPAALKNKP